MPEDYSAYFEPIVINEDFATSEVLKAFEKIYQGYCGFCEGAKQVEGMGGRIVECACPIEWHVKGEIERARDRMHDALHQQILDAAAPFLLPMEDDIDD